MYVLLSLIAMVVLDISSTLHKCNLFGGALKVQVVLIVVFGRAAFRVNVADSDIEDSLAKDFLHISNWTFSKGYIKHLHFRFGAFSLLE